MLPRFQSLTQGGTGHLSLSSSFSAFYPPRYHDELLSSVETDRTILIQDRPATLPPSPSTASLLFVSVPLPEAAAAVADHAQHVEVAGLVLSPAVSDPHPYIADTSPVLAQRTLWSAGAVGEPRHAPLTCGASRYPALGDALSDDDSDIPAMEEEEGDGAADFGDTTGSNYSSSANSREEEWSVVWTQLFPLHIAGFLTVRDVVEVSLVSRCAYAAVRQPWVWRTLASCHFGTHPSSLERVFAAAAREWEGGSPSSSAPHSPRLRVRDRAPPAQQLRISTHEGAEETMTAAINVAAARTASTTSTPWLLRREHSDALTMEDAVELSPSDDSLSDEEAAEDSSLRASLDATRVPHPRHDSEEDLVVTEAAPSQRTASTPSVALAESIVAVRPDSVTPAAPAAPAVVRATTRAALASGSRYLWQTTAAAMPSPSSPVPSPRPEVDSDETTSAEASSTSPPPPQQQSSSQAVTSASLAVSGGEGCSGTVLAEPASVRFAAPTAAATTALAVPPLLTPSSTCVSASPGASCGSPRAAAVEKKTSEKWAAGSRRPIAEEQLPPPTPAQLDHATLAGAEAGQEADVLSDGEEGYAGRREVAGGEERDAVLAASASFSSPRLHRHSSYVLEMATDVTVTGAEGGVPRCPSTPRLPVCDLVTVRSMNARGAAVAAVASPPQQPTSPSPLPVPTQCFTLCRATAERTIFKTAPAFPWELLTRFLYTNRVLTELERLTALSAHAREELCRGAWEGAYGSLSHIIHALFQQGSCRSVEFLQLLAQTLVRRASLCRHRGHLHLRAAFTDLCTATLLCPESVVSADIEALSRREEFAALTPESWMQQFDAAGGVASPVALLGSVAQVPFLFPRHRTLCFCGAVASYIRVHRILGHSLHHLLSRAAEWATPGSEEELLVRALRETAHAKQHIAAFPEQETCPPHRQRRSLVRQACATADYALSLMSLQVRRSVEVLSAAWVRECFRSEGVVYGPAMTQWLTHAPEALQFAQSASLEVRWLAWLTCEVHSFVYKELTDTLPAKDALTSVVLALTRHDYATGLVRMAAQYANYDVRTEDLVPALPRGANRHRVTQYLLHHALKMRPLHPTAALLLSRQYAAEEESVPLASAVLTDCIHKWARRFSLLDLDTAAPRQHPRGGMSSSSASSSASSPPSSASLPFLHRRDRSPATCFIPSELLVGRNHCLHMVADLAEATEQHPSLSYPYQMRAAMAMDRGYHLAAVLEMGRVMRLTLDPADVALRVRFLHDAIEIAAQPNFGEAESSAETTTAAPTRVASEVSTADAAAGTAEAITEARPALTSHATPAVYPTPSLSLEGSGQRQEDAAPLEEEAARMLSVYRAWLSRMSGLLTLLRPPPPPPPPPPRVSSASSLSAASAAGMAHVGTTPSSSRVFGREMASLSTLDISDRHVSRVASMALSEVDGEGVLISNANLGNAGGDISGTRIGGAGGATDDAANMRAFLDELVHATATISSASI